MLGREEVTPNVVENPRQTLHHSRAEPDEVSLLARLRARRGAASRRVLTPSLGHGRLRSSCV
eukprot:8534214-Pyramimonas_sp.AAC.1